MKRFWQKIKITTPLTMILSLIPTIIVQAAGSTNQLELYESVWWSTFWIWVVTSIVGAVISAFMLAMYDSGCGLWTILIGIVVIGLIGAFINSGKLATKARTSDWDAMVIEKATFKEKLLGVWVDYEITPHTCHYADTESDNGAIAATGCKNVVKVSYCDSYDDEGNCDDTDYEWFPMFTQEETLTAEINIYQGGHITFCDHCALEEWSAYISSDTKYTNTGHFWNGTNLKDGARPGVDFSWIDRSDWDRVTYAVDHQQLLPAVVYQNTLNWVNADPETILRGSTQIAPMYQKLGLLPEILPITNGDMQTYTQDIFGHTTGSYGFDFQVVQFLGSLNPSDKFQSDMQQQASLLASTIGPNLRGNIQVNFAYASEVPNPDEWISISKAYQMDNSVWANTPFKTTLAMNMAIWNCGVSDDMTTVLWCRMETGAFEDNVELKIFVSQIEPFNFTPTNVFGTVSGGFTGATQDYEWDDRDLALPVVEVNFTGGVINEAMFGISSGHEFVKVSKEIYQHKQLIITPDESQIDRIKASNSSTAFMRAGGIWLLIIIGAGVILSQD